MLVFKTIKDYLTYKKHHNTNTFDEFGQELIIASSPNLRIGDSVYWFNYLN